MLLIEIFGNDLQFCRQPGLIGIGRVAKGHALIVMRLL